MMELIERAIPVIQHSPETHGLIELALVERSATPASGGDCSAAEPASHPEPARSEEAKRLDVESALSGVHAVLERLHLQQAQLTSGAVLQQYQRQVAFEVEDSRPATKVLSVQG